MRNKLLMMAIFISGNFCIAAENVATSKDGKSEKNNRVEKIKRGAFQGALLGFGCAAGGNLGCSLHFKEKPPKWGCVGGNVGSVCGVLGTRAIQAVWGTTTALGLVLVGSATAVNSMRVHMKNDYDQESEELRNGQDYHDYDEDKKNETEEEWKKESHERCRKGAQALAIWYGKAAVVGAGVGAVLINFLPVGVLPMFGV